MHNRYGVYRTFILTKYLLYSFDFGDSYWREMFTLTKNFQEKKNDY
jgi:hypothetical protein